MTEFFQTTMGQRFYQSTMPRLIEAIERLAVTLEENNKIKVIKESKEEDNE